MSLLFGRRRKVPTPTSPNTSAEGIGSDRLRKAIERNRNKQMKREGLEAPRPSNDSSFSRPTPPRESSYQSEPGRYNQNPSSSYNRPSSPGYSSRPLNSPSESPYQSPSSNYNRPSSSPRPSSNFNKPSTPGYSRPASSSSSPTRPPASRPLPGSPTTTSSNPYSNTQTKYPAPKTNNPPSKYFRYFLKGLWIFSVFLFLRLVFTDRGVMEYYSRNGTLKEKYDNLADIKKANRALEREIKKVKTNSGYQKSLVRNHLGFIAKDEYIVLLPD